MRKFGLIGFPLGHSFSKKYFTEKFEKEGLSNCEFELFEIPSIVGLKKVISENPTVEGLCVTIPYKLEVMPFLDEISPSAKQIGAVNCIQFKENKLIGYNTDFIGFRDSLAGWLEEERPKALILGTGGASKAVAAALDDLGIEFQFVSRSGKANAITYKELSQRPEIMNDHQLIINSTPLGTFPEIESMPPIPLDQISKDHLYYDLVYNPAETAMMKTVTEKGGRAKNGMEMLIGQAEAAWKIWND